MARNCFAPGCKSGYLSVIRRNKALGKKNPSLFSAPRDPVILEEWRRAIPRKDKIFGPSHKLCELHFDEEVISRTYNETKLFDGSIFVMKKMLPRLKVGAVPTKFPDVPNYLPPQRNSINTQRSTISTVVRNYLPSQRNITTVVRNYLAPQKNSINTEQRNITTVHTCLSENETIISCDDVLDEARNQNQVLQYENLLEELDNIKQKQYEKLIEELDNTEKPDHWWTISHTLDYVACSKWGIDYSCERRVILFKDFSYKIFLRDVQVSIEDTSIQNTASLSQLLQKVNRLIICQSVGSQKSDNCAGYISEDKLHKFKIMQCRACTVLRKYMYKVQKRKTGLATKKNKMAQKLRNVKRRNIRLLKQVADLKKRMQNTELLYSKSWYKQGEASVTDGCKTNGEATEVQQFKAEPTNQGFSENLPLIPTEHNKGIENPAHIRNYIVVAEFVVCNECK